MDAKLTGVSYDQCSSIYQRQQVVLNRTQLCAGGTKGVDACRGDSGGPIMSVGSTDEFSYNYLAGIVSFGPISCGTEGWPSVYTRVDQYLDWILSHMHN